MRGELRGILSPKDPWRSSLPRSLCILSSVRRSRMGLRWWPRSPSGHWIGSMRLSGCYWRCLVRIYPIARPVDWRYVRPLCLWQRAAVRLLSCPRVLLLRRRRLQMLVRPPLAAIVLVPSLTKVHTACRRIQRRRKSIAELLLRHIGRQAGRYKCHWGHEHAVLVVSNGSTKAD